MNDTELLTAVSESFAGVRTATPVERIVSRGRTLRTRRRIPRVAGAVAAAAGTAIALAALLPIGPAPGQPAGQQTGAQLAAWTVTRQADGAVRVTIRELQDPAGLQRTLRADGIPASVTAIAQPNPACRPYPASRALRARILSQTFEFVRPSAPPQPGVPPQSGLVLILLIHPAALPAGTGVQISASFTPVSPTAGRAMVAMALVYASPACTG